MCFSVRMLTARCICLQFDPQNLNSDAQIWISTIDKDHFRKDKDCFGINSHGPTVDGIDCGYIRAEDKLLRFTTTLESFHRGDASINYGKNILTYKIIFVLSSINTFDWTTHVNMTDIVSLWLDNKLSSKCFLSPHKTIWAL